MQLSSGPLVSPGSITAPQPAVATYRRSRLFFPTLFLIFLILAALAGGGVFYFVHSNQNSAIAQALDKAQQKIASAQAENGKDPARALQDLSTAQSTLKALPQTLDDNQTGQLTSLQNQMVEQVKTAIGQYNKLNNIAILPCNSTNISPVNAVNTQPQNIVAVQNSKGTGTSLFTLTLGKNGSNGSVYQINDQLSLVSVLPNSPTSSYISIASGGSQLFTLAEQLNNGVPVPDGYTLSMYTLDQTGKLMPPIITKIDQTYTAGGYVPIPTTALAAWGSSVYVVLANANQTQGKILKYAPDVKNHLVATSPFTVSTSAPIASVTTFSNHSLCCSLMEMSRVCLSKTQQ